MGHNLGLSLLRWIAELDGDKPLARAVFEVLQRALVAGVVGHHQQEPVRGLQELALLLYWKNAAVVGQRVNEHRSVLARLDDLVEVADAPRLYRASQRPVDPDRLLALQKVAAHEVARRKVLVTRDGHQRQGAVERPIPVRRRRAVVLGNPGHRLPKPVRHVLHKPGLPATGWAFEQHGNLRLVRDLEQLDLVPDGHVVRLIDEVILLDDVAAVKGLRLGGHRVV